MHFDFLPKVTHNEDAIREHNRQENKRIRRGLTRLAIAFSVILLVAWLYLHFH